MRPAMRGRMSSRAQKRFDADLWALSVLFDKADAMEKMFGGGGGI